MREIIIFKIKKYVILLMKFEIKKIFSSENKKILQAHLQAQKYLFSPVVASSHKFFSEKV